MYASVFEFFLTRKVLDSNECFFSLYLIFGDLFFIKVLGIFNIFFHILNLDITA